MTYRIEALRYGRPETVTDVQSFARDLSKALGGGDLSTERNAHDRNDLAEFMLGADLICVRGNHYLSKGRVEISISAPEIKHDDHDWYSKGHKTTSATVDPDARTMERIATDVRKRVIDASQGALTLQREYAANKAASRVGIVEHMEALRAALPSYQVKRQTDRDLSASIHGGASAAYVSATLNAEGTVSVQHIASMSVEKFIRVMRALNGEG